MREKGYYSLRTGKHPEGAKLDLAGLKKLFMSIYRSFQNKDYYQEAFGYDCVDAGSVPGTLGEDIEGVLVVEVRSWMFYYYLATIHASLRLLEKHDAV